MRVKRKINLEEAEERVREETNSRWLKKQREDILVEQFN
jgi:hypothetical protein